MRKHFFPSLTSTEPTTPPEPDELEVSLFGPGFGECVVAHLGWGDWIVVDSCVGPDGQTPVGLHYLKQIGVDAGSAVRRIVATHWHNDHIRGLSQTVQECANAKFICSNALLSGEFIALTDLWKRQRLAASPVAELTGVLDTIAKTDSILKGSTGDSRLGLAVANRCLWRRHHASGSEVDTSAELHSLSPSDAAVKESLDAIAALFPAGDILTQPLPSRPNQFSVVLWLRVGPIRLLMGADLEEQHNPHGGWKLIVESAERPVGESSLFKVPHHGSVTGECESVWIKLLQANPVALLTPFQLGGVRLPTSEDVTRICARTPHAFITASFRDRSSRGKTGTVNRTIQETVRYIRRVNDSFGHVRARRKLKNGAGEWSVAMFGDAQPLSKLYDPHSP